MNHLLCDRLLSMKRLSSNLSLQNIEDFLYTLFDDRGPRKILPSHGESVQKEFDNLDRKTQLIISIINQTSKYTDEVLRDYNYLSRLPRNEIEKISNLLEVLQQSLGNYVNIRQNVGVEFYGLLLKFSNLAYEYPQVLQSRLFAILFTKEFASKIKDLTYYQLKTLIEAFNYLVDKESLTPSSILLIHLIDAIHELKDRERFNFKQFLLNYHRNDLQRYRKDQTDFNDKQKEIANHLLDKRPTEELPTWLRDRPEVLSYIDCNYLEPDKLPAYGYGSRSKSDTYDSWRCLVKAGVPAIAVCRDFLTKKEAYNFLSTLSREIDLINQLYRENNIHKNEVSRQRRLLRPSFDSSRDQASNLSTERLAERLNMSEEDLLAQLSQIELRADEASSDPSQNSYQSHKQDSEYYKGLRDENEQGSVFSRGWDRIAHQLADPECSFRKMCLFLKPDAPDWLVDRVVYGSVDSTPETGPQKRLMFEWMIKKMPALSKSYQITVPGGEVVTQFNYSRVDEITVNDLVEGINTSTDRVLELARERSRQRKKQEQDEILGKPPEPVEEFSWYIKPGIVQLTDSHAIVKEGLVMNHCVGSYVDSAKKGTCYLFHVGEPAPKGSTVEIILDKDGYIEVAQQFGVHDSEPPKEDRELVNQWVQDFKAIRDKQRGYVVEESLDEGKTSSSGLITRLKLVAARLKD